MLRVNLNLHFDTLQPRKDNTTDAAIAFALATENRMLIAAAFKINFQIMLPANKQDGAVPILLSNLIERLRARDNLTPFAKIGLNLLCSLQRDPNYAKKDKLSEGEQEIVSNIAQQLYQANVDNIRAAAASKIQFWFRKHLNEKKLLDLKATEQSVTGKMM